MAAPAETVVDPSKEPTAAPVRPKAPWSPPQYRRYDAKNAESGGLALDEGLNVLGNLS